MKEKLKTAWGIFGIALFLIVTLEALSNLLIHIKNSISPSVDFNFVGKEYAEADWTQGYLREHNASFRLEWHPYIYWRRRPFQGKYIRINERGIRRTWNPTASGGVPFEKTIKIFMFGGSALWGTGARDDFTIPSHLARILAQKEGLPVQVTNFGESGYVSTQEVISLWLELRNGSQPDLVIFYDGTNDTYSSFQNQEAGIPENEFNREKEFNLLNETRRPDLYQSAFSSLTSSGLYRLFRSVYRRATGQSGIGVFPHRQIPVEKTDPLAGETLQVYQSNIERVQEMAHSFGFKALFYWQPALFTKKSKTSYESQKEKEMQLVESFYLKVESLLKKSSLLGNPNFHDISDLFDEEPEFYFIDFCHTTERGNEQIAARMSRDVIPLLKGGASS